MSLYPSLRYNYLVIRNTEVNFLHIVLIEPEIPGNTGNIARLCAATGIELHLVKVHVHENFAEVLEKYRGHHFHYCSTKAPRAHSEASYEVDDLIVLGKETAGIPEEILQEHWEECVRIPMVADARSLNLGNSAAIVAYEALRQLGFPGLAETGPGLHI